MVLSLSIVAAGRFSQASEIWGSRATGLGAQGMFWAKFRLCFILSVTKQVKFRDSGHIVSAQLVIPFKMFITRPGGVVTAEEGLQNPHRAWASSSPIERSVFRFRTCEICLK